MPVLSMIVASAMAAAQLPQPVVADSEYPQTALLKEKSAAAMLNLLIDPQGNVVSCTQTAAVGDEDLAKEMCEIVENKKAIPARDAAGKASFGFRRDFASLSLPGTSQGDEIGDIGPSPDIDFEVASIPAGVTSPVLVNVTISVDKSGKTTGCETANGSSNAAFAAAACQQIGGMDFPKLKDSSGRAVSYIRPMIVRFSQSDKS